MKRLSLVLLLFLPVLLYSESVYTTSINLKKYRTNNILVYWKANTNKATFAIYRSDDYPMVRPHHITNKKPIAEIELEGRLEKNLFSFPFYKDVITQSGKYYYLVLPKKDKYTDDDFAPNLNLSLSPFTIKVPKVVVPEKKEVTPVVTNIKPVVTNIAPVVTNIVPTNIVAVATNKVETNEIKTNVIPEIIPEVKQVEKTLFVKNIFVRQEQQSFLLLWDISRFDKGKDYAFKIYRSFVPFTNYSQISNKSPYRLAINEFYIEDYDIRSGLPYYYAVILSGHTQIQPSINATGTPIIIGSENFTVKVEREEIWTNETDSYVGEIKKDTQKVITNIVKKDSSPVSGREVDIEIKKTQKDIKDDSKKNETDKIEEIKDDGTLGIVDVEFDSDTSEEYGEEGYAPYDSGEDKVFVPKKDYDEEQIIYLKMKEDEKRLKNEVKKKVIEKEKFIIYYPKKNIPAKVKTLKPRKVVKKRVIKKSAPKYRIVRKKRPNYSANNYARGLELYKNAEYRRAISYLKLSGYKRAWFYIGKAYYRLEEYQSALKYFRLYRKINPNTAKIWEKMTLYRIGVNK